MKAFVENSENLAIRNFSRANALTKFSPLAKITAIIGQNKRLGEECEGVLLSLGSHLDDIESTLQMIFDGVEAKIEYMESYCDSIVSNANHIPTNCAGWIYTYTDNIKLENMSYIKGKGYILEAD